MKLFKKLRKGFTLIELVVVIAVIAILAAVSVVSYVAITNKAKQSNDQQKIDQVNLSLAALEVSGKPETMYKAVKAVEEDGFKPENFKAEAKDYTFAYKMSENRFVILQKGKIVYPKDVEAPSSNADLWKFSDKGGELTDGYSYYLRGTGVTDPVTVAAGLDVGENASVPSVSYSSTASQDVVIRTNGGVLNIGESATKLAKGQIHHYGVAKTSVVYTEHDCFHAYGAIGSLNLKAGKAIAEKEALVYLTAAQPGVEVKEVSTGKMFIPAGTTQAEDGTGVPVAVAAQISITPVEANPAYTYEDSTKVGGNTYGIANLAALEQFRDLVNGGFNFDGIKVELTKDITLADGWTPIGEGSRKAAANTTVGSEGWKYSGNVYKGEFDGKGHKIYNLNNKGYTPTLNCLGNDGGSKRIYAYGFFSMVAGDANIHDLEFVNVDIDTRRCTQVDNYELKGDCVAALVGFSAGSLTVDNVTISGTSSIIGHEAVAGIVGKAYNQDGNFNFTDNKPEISLTNCLSSASVTLVNSHYAVGLFGDIDLYNSTLKTLNFTSVTITDNTFTGNVYAKANGSSTNIAGIAILAVKDYKNPPTEFVHSGNTNSGHLYYGANNNVVENNLFVSMSSANVIETPRNVD